MADDIIPADPKATTAEQEEEGEEMRAEAIERRKERRRKQRNGRNGRKPSSQGGWSAESDSTIVDLPTASDVPNIDQSDVVVKQDDVENDNNDKPPPQITAAAEDNSNPTDTVYVQQQSGFRPGARQKMLEMLELRRKAEVETGGEAKETQFEGSMRPALLFHAGFHTIGLIIQGLIAGFSLCQCVFVIFSTPPWNMDIDRFAKDYQLVALPIHLVFYVTLSICTVASFDRYDPGGSFLDAVWRGVTLRSGAWSTVFYIAALAFSLASLPADYVVTLYTKTTALPDIDKQVQWINVCSIGRAVCSCVPWAIVAVRPNTDLLLNRIEEAQEALGQFEINNRKIIERENLEPNP